LQDVRQRQVLAAAEFTSTEVPLGWRIARSLGPVRTLEQRLFAYGGLWPERLAA